MIKGLEILDFIKSDGTVYPLQSPPSRLVISNTGWGKPGDALSTTSGPYQHGVSPVSFRLIPRTIQISLQHTYANRSDYWSGRSQLLSQLSINNASPNAPVTGVLRLKYYENDLVKTRCLDVFLKNGLVYEQPENWQGFSIVENLEFEAENPIIYDPAVKTSTINSFTASLILPMTFPFVLGGYYGTSAITYTGTWESFPTIAVAGPATDFFIENLSTGAIIRLSYTISVGETVTFNLSYDSKTITNNFGQNLLPYLRGTDLTVFSLSHLVTGGINNFLVYLDGYAASTSIVLSYYNRYYGI